MDWVTILGLTAATFTTGCYLPQAIKTIRTRHTKDISLGMYIAVTVGVLLWLVYGLLINNLPIIIANAVTMVLTIIILSLKLRYK